VRDWVLLVFLAAIRAILVPFSSDSFLNNPPLDLEAPTDMAAEKAGLDLILCIDRGMAWLNEGDRSGDLGSDAISSSSPIYGYWKFPSPTIIFFLTPPPIPFSTRPHAHSS